MADKRPVDAAGARPHPPRPSRDQPRSAVVAFALLLGGAAASIFLVGHAEEGNVGVFLVCAGAAMLCCPPRVAVNPWLLLPAALFLVCSGSALLPARLFHAPAWREAFAAAPDLPLPSTVSAAPAQTAFWLAVLAVTVLTGLFALTQPVHSKGLATFASVGAVVCGAYAALSILAKLPGWFYPYSTPGTFGFFPNRNHTATLLITGSILSMGILGVGFRQRQRWAVNAAVATFTLCVAGLLFFSESRGGVVFLLVGVVVWVAGLGAHRDRRILIAATLVVLIGGGLFLAAGRGARDRLLASVSVTTAHPVPEGTVPPENPPGERPTGDITADDRLRIYRDTLGMIRDVPLTGTGLGTFQLVFAPYRLTSANYNLILHPESDWLMIAAETGLPALGCLVVLIGLALGLWRPLREHPYWPLRWACLVAAGAAALHGCVDVPLHRAALGWWVLVLAGLALQPGRTPEGGPRTGATWLAARVLFVLGGLGALILGAQLIRAEWLGGPASAPYAATRARVDIARTFRQGDLDGATEQARQAVRDWPLVAPLYYDLGVLLIRVEDTDAEIDRAFRLERLLNPWAPRVPRAQAVVWMPLDPTRSTALFAEALKRQEELRRISPTALAPLVYWGGLVQQTGSFPKVQDGLWDIGVQRGSDFVVAWLANATAENARLRLSQVAENDGFLSQLDAEQRKKIVSIWQARGDQAALKTFLDVRGTEWAK